MPMPITYAVHNRVLTASLTGEIDHHSARGLMAELDRAIDELLPRQLILDLSGVSFMDSSGIAVLLRTWRRLEELDGTLEVVKAPPQCARVLRAAGVERMIPMT